MEQTRHRGATPPRSALEPIERSPPLDPTSWPRYAGYPVAMRDQNHLYGIAQNVSLGKTTMRTPASDPHTRDYKIQ
jgi:hypothetical protein